MSYRSSDQYLFRQVVEKYENIYEGDLAPL